MANRRLQTNNRAKIGWLIVLGAVYLFTACGIKGDPVPPVAPVNWGDSMQKKDKVEEKKDENR